MVDIADPVALGVLLRPRADEQDADRQSGRPGRLGMAVRQAPADADGALALEQPGTAIVEQLPGKRQQLGGGFASGSLGLLRRVFGQLPVHLHGKPALRTVCRLLPSGQSLPDGFRPQRGLEQLLTPLRHLARDPLGALLGQLVRPDEIGLQVPPQIPGLDRPDRRNEPEPPALDRTRAGLGRLVDEHRHARGAAFALGRLDLGIGQLQDQLFDALGVGLVEGLEIGGQALPQSGEERGHGGAQPARADLDRYGDRFFVEPGPQRPRRDTRQEQRDDAVSILPGLFDLKSFLDLAAYPGRIDGGGAEHGDEMRRRLDGRRDLRRELAATPQAAGVHPDGDLMRLQRLAQLGHEPIVSGGVRDEDHGIGRLIEVLRKPMEMAMPVSNRDSTDSNRGSADSNRDFAYSNRGSTDSNRDFADSNRESTDSNRDFADSNRDSTHSNRDSADSNRDFTDSNRDFAGSNRDFTDSIRDFTDSIREFGHANGEYGQSTREEQILVARSRLPSPGPIVARLPRP
jgi:hypothetical protein